MKDHWPISGGRLFGSLYRSSILAPQTSGLWIKILYQLYSLTENEFLAEETFENVQGKK